MSELVELLDNEAVVTELVTPEDYIKHRNQVACVTDKRLVFLKKKTLGAYYTIEYIPLSQCTQISYRKTLAIGSMIGGACLAFIGLLVFVFAVTGQLRDLSAVIYGIPLIGIGGALVFGLKRHKLVFRCGDRNFTWVSSAGKFSARRSALHKLREHAYGRGILVNEFTI